MHHMVVRYVNKTDLMISFVLISVYLSQTLV